MANLSRGLTNDICAIADTYAATENRRNAESMARACEERASAYGDLRKSSLTAIVLDKAAASLRTLVDEAYREGFRAGLRTAANELPSYDAAIGDDTADTIAGSIMRLSPEDDPGPAKEAIIQRCAAPKPAW